MAADQTIKYFVVIGHRRITDGTEVIHFLRQVADYTGADMPAGTPPIEDTYPPVPIAQLQADGTIVKVTYYSGKTIQLNPTS